MQTLSDTEWLDLWERGQCRHPVDRAVLLLAAAFPAVSRDTLAGWPIGRRNQALIQLRSRCFGPCLSGWLACAHCRANLEFELDANCFVREEAVVATVEVLGHTFRLPNSRDLALVANGKDYQAGPAAIAGNCLMGTLPPPDWSESELSAIGDGMAAADPLAEIWLTLNCPDCGAEAHELFDVVTYLWAEVEVRARQMLRTVHALASAYGWSEAEILSLSESRRALYFELVHS